MPLRIAIVNGSAEELDELAAELDAVAVRHQRAAMAAAVELENDESVKDKRTGALAIFKTLAEAGRFTTWAIEVRDHRDAAPAAELTLDLPDHAPDAAPSREEVLAGVEAHVAAVNGHDPDDDLPSPEELELAKAAALVDDGSDPVAEDGDR